MNSIEDCFDLMRGLIYEELRFVPNTGEERLAVVSPYYNSDTVGCKLFDSCKKNLPNDLRSWVYFKDFRYKLDFVFPESCLLAVHLSHDNTLRDIRHVCPLPLVYAHYYV